MINKIVLLLFTSLLGSSSFANNIVTNNIGTNSLEYDIGPYKKSELEIKPGKCDTCIGKAASFYFAKDQVVVLKNNPDRTFIWNNISNQIEGTLSSDGKTFSDDKKQYHFTVTPKIESNLSYYNDTSIQFFSNKKMIVKGMVKDNLVLAQSIWPSDYSFNKDIHFTPINNDNKGNNTKVNLKSLVQNESLHSFDPLVLWAKDNSNHTISLKNKPVLGFILNGAQGDDDEAHGGHFAVATGTVDSKGQFNNLLVNNFYGLNSFSEKGIVASRLPLDLYQADLNSGQSWYRPSYMLFAVLKNDKLSRQYQDSINKKFNDFYEHHFEYNHALANCSGINLDTLRGLGWSIPKSGVESYIKGIGAIPYVTLTDSFENAKKGSNYMMSEKTNLYPFVAFDSIGQDFLSRIVKGEHLKSDFEKQLYENLEAIVYVKIPQFPSSRAFGLAPVYSFDEYMKRVPVDKKDWKIVPVGPRPFPDNLKDNKIEGFTLQPYIFAILVNVLIVLLFIFGIYTLVKIVRRKKS